MSSNPGMEPPPGEVVDFDNPDREMFYICIVSNAIAIPVCTIFLALRLWARLRLRLGFQTEDSKQYLVLLRLLLRQKMIRR